MKKSRKDPICGMKGSIPAYGKFFCSQNCMAKYEQKKGLTPPLRRRFKTLIYAVVVVLLVALVAVLQLTDTMVVFMGVFFVIVAILKMLDWKGFSMAFGMYDIVAVKSKAYAYVYPVLELAIGIAFLLSYQIVTAAVILFIIMVVGTIGVARNLMSKSPVKCACFGTLIKIPLTKFTLFEDITMAVMSLMILFF